MFGKIFGSMFEGSLVGKGALVFAVMSYAISKATPAKDRMQVTMNPHMIAAAIGEPVEDVKEVIAFLCAPDPESTTKEEEGRRLVKIGAFDYWLVNGMKYRAIRDEEQRREQNRAAQERYRAKHIPKHKPLKGETQYEKLADNGATPEQLDEHVTKHLPRKVRNLKPEDQAGDAS